MSHFLFIVVASQSQEHSLDQSKSGSVLLVQWQEGGSSRRNVCFDQVAATGRIHVWEKKSRTTMMMWYVFNSQDLESLGLITP